MSEGYDFQSNRPLTFSPYPILLDPLHPMPGEIQRTLWFLVDGHPNACFVTLDARRTIQDLKKCIKEEEALHDVALSGIELWKLNVPLAVEPDESLAERVHEYSKANHDFLHKLRNTDTVGASFPDPPVNHLHIIVKLLPAGMNEVNPVFTFLWRTFWGKVAPECFFEDSIKIPDLRTLAIAKDKTKFTYLQLSGDNRFPCGSSRILITETYTSFYDELCREDLRWLNDANTYTSNLSTSHSTVITGQPGIGKTVSLSYILVRRLQEKKPTVYCNNKAFACVFTDSGVQKVSCLNGQRISALDACSSCCGLVNINPHLRKVPEQFHPENRRGRVVVATSPNPNHFGAFKESPARIYTWPTWKWDELYCACVILKPDLSGPLHDERLLTMFTRLRGIPRRVFAALFDDDGEAAAEDKIKVAIKEIQSIEDFVDATMSPLPFKTSASHILVRLEPGDDKWGSPSTSLLSDYVAELVYDRIRLHHTMSIPRAINHLLNNPPARGWGGKLFEKFIHRQFRAGIKFSPQGMDIGSPALDISIDPVGTEAGGYFHTLSVRAQPRSRQVDADICNQYLIPLSSTAETIDSVYISKDVTVFFQITVSPSHDLNLKGITELTEELPFEAKKRICIVFVVPEHPTTARPYKRQNIVVPNGVPEAVSREVVGYKQYVYYAKMPVGDGA